MIFSATCNYALRASLYIASYQQKRPFVPIREIADNLGISFHFLTKILQVLTQKGLMVSFRGPHGGVSLAKKADEISLLEIVRAVEGDALFQRCLLGLEHCNDQSPCPLHSRWSSIRREIQDLLSRTSLGKLSRKVLSEGLRLKASENVKS